MAPFISKTHSAFIKFFNYFFLAISLFGVTFYFNILHDYSLSISSIPESSIVNIVTDGILLLMALITIVGKKKQFYELVNKEIFLVAIVILCFISISWSYLPMVTAKRAIRTAVIYICSAAFIVNTENEEERIKYLYKISWVYIIITLLSVFLFEGAKDSFGNYTGLSDQKNQLGQILFASIFCCYAGIVQSKGSGKKLVLTLNLFFIFIGCYLIVNTNSITSLICLILVFLIIMTKYLDYIFKSKSLKNIFITLLLCFFCSISIIMTLYFKNSINTLLTMIGRDLTFSDRITLWQFIFNEIKQHPILGIGYQAFWVVGSIKREMIIDTFQFYPFGAHNGYLDLLNELGILGLSTIVIMIIRYFYFNNQLRSHKILHIFVLSFLFLNLQESAILSPYSKINTIFIIFYLSMFSDITLLKLKLSDFPKKNPTRSTADCGK